MINRDDMIKKMTPEDRMVYKKIIKKEVFGFLKSYLSFVVIIAIILLLASGHKSSKRILEDLLVISTSIFVVLAGIYVFCDFDIICDLISNRKIVAEVIVKGKVFERFRSQKHYYLLIDLDKEYRLELNKEQFDLLHENQQISVEFGVISQKPVYLCPK
jgi:hypothetical protein